MNFIERKIKKEKVKNGITELVFILDRSGSMSGLEDDTIGGFNATIESQREKGGKVYVSTVLFSYDSIVIHDRTDINQIKPMTRDEYQVGGATSLLDSIGDAMHHITTVHKYARSEDIPEKTIFVITTDGQENASRRYSYKMIKERITRAQKKMGWEFLFLGANIDVAKTADDLGIRKERAARFGFNKKGVESSYYAMNEAIRYYRDDDDTFDLEDLVDENYNK